MGARAGGRLVFADFRKLEFVSDFVLRSLKFPMNSFAYLFERFPSFVQTFVYREVAEMVRLLGPRPQTEVRRLLAQAQLFVLPCVVEADGGSDNLPTVIIEAMLAGVPVISTTVAGVPEMIAAGEDGLLTPPGDPAALAAALERLVLDAALGERLATRARQSAVAKFSVETTVRELQCLLIRQAPIFVPEAARDHDSTLPEVPRTPFWTGLMRRFRP